MGKGATPSAGDSVGFGGAGKGAGIRPILEQFQEKWIPLFRPKLRKTNDPGAVFDAIKS
jgi:hypothetical protein